MVQPASDAAVYLTKAQKSLVGAELEFAHELYNNTVNRAYYACYQAAVAALTAEGLAPPMPNYWSHDFVQVEFPARLVDERQRYAPALRCTLKSIFDERLKADYEPEIIGASAAAEALHQAQEFVSHVSRRLGAK
jgi:uncharacterized protein (UPF0332 family)